MIDTLERLFAQLYATASGGDAEGLAETTQRLEEALRWAHARLCAIRLDIGMGVIPKDPQPKSDSLVQKAYDIELQYYTNILWARWEPRLRDAYLDLGQKSVSKGRMEPATVLFGQALAADPALSLSVGEALGMGRRFEVSKGRDLSMSGDAAPINLIWHSANRSYLVVDGKTELVRCVDRSLHQISRLILSKVHPYSIFPGKNENIWVCDAREARILELDDELSVVQIIRLTDLIGHNLRYCFPVYGTLHKGRIYLVVYNTKSHMTKLLRFNISDDRKKSELFCGKAFQHVFRVFSYADNLVVMRNGPSRCTVFREDEHRLREIESLHLPSQLPCHPHCFAPVGQVFMITTANSFICLDKDFFPVFRHDQQNTMALKPGTTWHRFTKTDDGDTLVVLSDDSVIQEICIN